MSGGPPILEGERFIDGRRPFGRLFSARPEGSPYPKAALLPRLLARLTDFVLAALLPVCAGRPGAILAVLYLLFADGMFRGQSPGKRLLGIKVVHLGTLREAGSRESAMRNFPFALAMLMRALPGLEGLPFLAAALAVVAAEGWRIREDRLGLRLGDLAAGTQVVDTRALATQPLRPVLKVGRSEGPRARSAARTILFGPRRARRQVR